MSSKGKLDNTSAINKVLDNFLVKNKVFHKFYSNTGEWRNKTGSAKSVRDNLNSNPMNIIAYSFSWGRANLPTNMEWDERHGFWEDISIKWHEIYKLFEKEILDGQ